MTAVQQAAFQAGSGITPATMLTAIASMVLGDCLNGSGVGIRVGGLGGARHFSGLAGRAGYCL